MVTASNIGGPAVIDGDGKANLVARITSTTRAILWQLSHGRSGRIAGVKAIDRIRFAAWVCLLSGFSLFGQLAACQSLASADEPQATGLYHQIVTAYLNGKWDEVDRGLLAPPEQLASLNARELEDIAYIRAALAECHPPWWNLCKKGQKVLFRPVVWSKTLSVTYVPDGQRGVQVQYHNADVTFTATWPAAEMDSPARFEHGFTKGEINAVEVWAMLGTARVWSQTSGRMLAGLGEKEKLRMMRREDFRSNLTALYYGSPKSRRWSMLVDLLTWTDKEYADTPVAGSRKAVGAMFLAELLANTANYLSLPLPNRLESDEAEKILAAHYRKRIERQGWTLAEDRSLREAIKRFAAVNDANVYQTEKATLANKLTVSVDSAADTPLRAKRDAWLKARFDEAQRR
ncbi:MAG TPA: hypothetical protein VG056_16485 [Pirellulales bacterium]|nr:hypothetical protein [Pirellulales bacterium]